MADWLVGLGLLGSALHLVQERRVSDGPVKSPC